MSVSLQLKPEVKIPPNQIRLNQNSSVSGQLETTKIFLFIKYQNFELFDLKPFSDQHVEAHRPSAALTSWLMYLDVP